LPDRGHLCQESLEVCKLAELEASFDVRLDRPRAFEIELWGPNQTPAHLTKPTKRRSRHTSGRSRSTSTSGSALAQEQADAGPETREGPKTAEESPQNPSESFRARGVTGLNMSSKRRDPWGFLRGTALPAAEAQTDLPRRLPSLLLDFRCMAETLSMEMGGRLDIERVEAAEKTQ
jgi:hypothetical protein